MDLRFRIEKIIIHEPVVTRIQSCHQRVMIWKSLGWKGRDQSLCAAALFNEFLKVGSVVFLNVVVPKTIERYQQHVWRILRRSKVTITQNR